MEEIKARKPGSIISKVYISDNSMDCAIGPDGEYRDEPKVEFQYVEYDSRLNLSSLANLDQIIDTSHLQRTFCRYYTLRGGRWGDKEDGGTIYQGVYSISESESGSMMGTSKDCYQV